MIVSTTNFFSTNILDMSKREKTYFSLIDASIDLLADKGFHNASVKAICQQSEVANGTFYNYFVDKEDIYSQASLYISRHLTKYLDSKKSKVKGAANIFKTGYLEYINYLSVRPNWAAVLIQSQRGHYGKDVWSLNKRRVSADIKRGIKEGVFKIKFDNFLVDQIMQIVLHSIGQQIVFAPSKSITNKTSIAIMRLLKYEES
jgi:AcrR family transcriptional regulator|tara:strand:+ start:4196 stop:4801 length:606 start_codon:yes stop_codon:yes gene_type:complete